MDEREQRHEQSGDSETPGESSDWKSGLVKPLMGLGASIVLTLASFWAAGTPLVWGPGVPVLLAALAAERRRVGPFYLSAVFTVALGATFLAIELSEFAGMVSKGAGPSRSAFLSGFFTLVGTHGVHVTSGLLFLVYMMAQVIAKGLRPHVLRRLLCFSLFWHALDIVWVGVFTLIYLMGAR